jgi:hypothetical protein
MPLPEKIPQRGKNTGAVFKQFHIHLFYRTL